MQLAECNHYNVTTTATAQLLVISAHTDSSFHPEVYTWFDKKVRLQSGEPLV